MCNVGLVGFEKSSAILGQRITTSHCGMSIFEYEISIFPRGMCLLRKIVTTFRCRIKSIAEKSSEAAQ